MQIYFSMDNTRPATLGDLAALLGTRDQRLVQDAIQICCPARPGEPGIHRILKGDSERLRNYVQKKYGPREFNDAQRQFLNATLHGKTFTR